MTRKEPWKREVDEVLMMTTDQRKCKKLVVLHLRLLDQALHLRLLDQALHLRLLDQALHLHLLDQALHLRLHFSPNQAVHLVVALDVK